MHRTSGAVGRLVLHCRLRHWETYIARAWGEPGWAECCYQNDCNGMGRVSGENSADRRTTVTPQDAPPKQIPSSSASSVMNCYLCGQIKNTACSAMRQSTSALRRLAEEGEGDQGPRATLVGSVLQERQRQQAKQAADEGDLGDRVEFDSMVLGMVNGANNQQQGFCRCLDGFIPVMSSEGMLVECHDPIFRSAIVGSRCLTEQHCSDLPETR